MENVSKNFIEQIIEEDLKNSKHDGLVSTRFPPEPNGYLHIGHAKSIFLNYGLAQKYKGTFNLRFDDTNPEKEEKEYVEAIINDLRWLGVKWDNLYFASDYFEKMYELAVQLISKNLAFVCDLSLEESKEYKGDYNIAGKPSPYRDRSIEDNLDLFHKMKEGKFKDGEKTLRAKIDFNHPNMNMRDPVIYRILHLDHHNTKSKWCIYPMYDFAHPMEDAIEEITHSICTLEFEANREVYDWYAKNLESNFKFLPHQYEFARLNITKTMMGKRYLKKLVDEKIVDGWDDPRMPTISGLRRRGVSALSLKNFVTATGVSKANSMVEIEMFEHFIREDLQGKLCPIMCVIDPIKVVIENYNDGEIEYLEADFSNRDKFFGSRKLPFSKEIYIERNDFMENPPSDYKRLSLGEEVRLRHAYFIKLNEIIRDENGKLIELRCSYDKETKSGSGFKARKPKGTIHWISKHGAKEIKCKIYDYLMIENENRELEINENSLSVYNSLIEESAKFEANQKYEFIRNGYFTFDAKSDVKNPTFSLIVPQKSRN